MSLFITAHGVLKSVSSLSLVSSRFYTANRAAVCKINRSTTLRTYPATLVLPDGSSIQIRYPTPRQIIKLPIDLTTASREEIKRVKRLRRPKSEVEKQEVVTADFDPMQYVKK